MGCVRYILIVLRSEISYLFDSGKFVLFPRRLKWILFNSSLIVQRRAKNVNEISDALNYVGRPSECNATDEYKMKLIDMEFNRSSVWSSSSDYMLILLCQLIIASTKSEDGIVSFIDTSRKVYIIIESNSFSVKEPSILLASDVWYLKCRISTWISVSQSSNPFQLPLNFVSQIKYEWKQLDLNFNSAIRLLFDPTRHNQWGSYERKGNIKTYTRY